eukprot:gene24336-9952_t
MSGEDDIAGLKDVSGSAAFEVSPQQECSRSQLSEPPPPFLISVLKFQQRRRMHILDQLVERLEIPTEKADACKLHFSQLHEMLFAAMTREKDLLDEARNLNRQLQEDERPTKVAQDDSRAQVTIDSLQEDERAAKAAQDGGGAQASIDPLRKDMEKMRGPQRQLKMEDERAAKAAQDGGGAQASIDPLRKDMEKMRGPQRQLKMEDERAAKAAQDGGGAQASIDPLRKDMESEDERAAKAAQDGGGAQASIDPLRKDMESFFCFEDERAAKAAQDGGGAQASIDPLRKDMEKMRGPQRQLKMEDERAAKAAQDGGGAQASIDPLRKDMEKMRGPQRQLKMEDERAAKAAQDGGGAQASIDPLRKDMEKMRGPQRQLKMEDERAAKAAQDGGGAQASIDPLRKDMESEDERAAKAAQDGGGAQASIDPLRKDMEKMRGPQRQLKMEDERAAKAAQDGGGAQASIDPLRKDMESEDERAAKAAQDGGGAQASIDPLRKDMEKMRGPQRQLKMEDERAAKAAQDGGGAQASIDPLRKDMEKMRGPQRQLKMEDERATKAAQDGGGAEASIDSLREDVESALGEASLAQERQQLLQLEVTELQRQRNEVAQRCNELADVHAAALHPVIRNLRGEVSTLTAEAADLYPVIGNLRALHPVIGNLRGEVSTLTAEVEDEKHRSDLTRSDLEQSQGKLKAVETKERQADAIRKDVEMASIEADKIPNWLRQKDDRPMPFVETKERQADAIRKDVEMASIEADKILADQVDIDLKIKNAFIESKLEAEILTRKNREKELIDKSLVEQREQLPALRFQIHQLLRDRKELDNRIVAQKREMEEAKRDLDITMNHFLTEEGVGKDNAASVQLTLKQVTLMDEELRHLKHEEGERAKILKELASQRDRVALAIAQKLAKVKEIELSVRIREVELAELKKIQKDVQRRTKDYQKLYELVKNQRNKFVNLIQSVHEMKDKSKILHSESDILHSEVNVKGKLLSQSRSQHQSAVSERDQLRIELGKYGTTFRNKQSTVDEQIAEVDKLNAIINLAEKEMLKLRKQYEVVIEARNYTGIMLIDRNDELCILYEKSNILGEVLKGGVLELSHRDDEERMLRIEVMELERSIATTIKVVPKIPLLDEDVARLQQTILETRREAEALSVALENPGNHSRWRLLEGKIPDKEELVAKVQQVEERLNDKKEQLLEKELILEEVSTLSDKLRVQATEGRADTIELAKRVNEYQAKLRAVTRKIMATATSLKLGSEKEELEGEVMDARDRVSQDVAPTDDAEREWYQLERQRLMSMDMADATREEERMLDAKAFATQSTAEPRPNAYIPEQLGIPKPYGTFTPFKPTEQGSTMRHIRKPQPKDIVI